MRLFARALMSRRAGAVVGGGQNPQKTSGCAFEAGWMRISIPLSASLGKSVFSVIFIFVWHAHLFPSADFTVPTEPVSPVSLVLGQRSGPEE